MLQSIEGIYKNGIIELAEKPRSVEESQVIVTFLETKSAPKTDQMMYFGMFAGSNQSTEEDFQIAEFVADTDDNLDWS
jgi:hypothetical protein